LVASSFHVIYRKRNLASHFYALGRIEIETKRLSTFSGEPFLRNKGAVHDAESNAYSWVPHPFALFAKGWESKQEILTVSE